MVEVPLQLYHPGIWALNFGRWLHYYNKGEVRYTGLFITILGANIRYCSISNIFVFCDVFHVLNLPGYGCPLF